MTSKQKVEIKNLDKIKGACEYKLESESLGEYFSNFQDAIEAYSLAQKPRTLYAIFTIFNEE